MLLRQASLRMGLAGMLALAGVASTMLCSAQTSTQTSTAFALTSTNWATSLTVPQFNSSQGTLTGVVVTLNWTTEQTIGVSNNDNSGKIDPNTGMPYTPGQTQYVYADEGVNVMLTYPSGGSLTGGLLVGAPADLILGSQDIFGDAAGPVLANTSQSEGPVITTLTTSSVAITDNATLALYTGSGNVSFAAAGKGNDTLQDSGGNIEWTASTFAGASVTVVYTYTPGTTSPPGPFTTFTQGGWGTAPHGGNPGAILAANWTKVFGTGGIYIGNPTGNCFYFNSQQAIENFLPNGGPDKLLPTGKSIDPTNSKSGNITGQLLSVELSLAFSGTVFKSGLGNLVIQSGTLKGYTVLDAAEIGNALVSGSAYPAGLPVVSMSAIDTVLTNITSAYDGGASSSSYIK